MILYHLLTLFNVGIMSIQRRPDIKTAFEVLWLKYWQVDMVMN